MTRSLFHGSKSLLLALLVLSSFNLVEAQTRTVTTDLSGRLLAPTNFLSMNAQFSALLRASNVVIEGDSFSSHQTETWARYLSNRCPDIRLRFITNASVGGDTISNIVLTTTNELGPFMKTNTGVNTYFLLQAGYNDLKTADSAQTIWLNISNTWAFARNSGCFVVGFTITESANFLPGQIKVLYDVNSLIRRYATNADWIIEADQILGNPALSELSYDGTHWTNTVNEQVERIVESVIFSPWAHQNLIAPPRTLFDARVISTASNQPAAIISGRTGATTNIAEFHVQNGRVASITTNGGLRITAGNVFFPSIATEGAPTVGFDSFLGNTWGWAQGSSERWRISSASGGATMAIQSSGAAAAIQFGTAITVNNCQIWVGNGTPEGAVTANVGSLFLRRDGGASTTLYVKESGTGNTGWIAK